MYQYEVSRITQPLLLFGLHAHYLFSIWSFQKGRKKNGGDRSGSQPKKTNKKKRKKERKERKTFYLKVEGSFSPLSFCEHFLFSFFC